MYAVNEQYFGDKNAFAVRYEPHYINGDFQARYAHCHFVFNGQIIGLLQEPCDVLTWMAGVQYNLNKIKAEPSVLSHSELYSRTDTEIFELLIKANQLEEDYTPEYSHLPALDNRIWSNCSFTIDETIDAYIIFMVEQHDMIKFIWKAWREPSPDQKIGKLYSFEISKQAVIDTMQSAMDFLKETYILPYN